MAQFGAGAEPASFSRHISRIAEQAGREILRHYHPGRRRASQDDRTPVTAADEAAEAIILPALAAWHRRSLAWPRKPRRGPVCP